MPALYAVVSGAQAQAADLNQYRTALSGAFVNVKSYGAVGDGTTDDTTAIQNAINALTAGGTVLFPPGTYKVTSALSVTVLGTTLMGVNRQASYITTTSTTIYAISVAASHFRLTGLGLLRTGSTATNGGAVQLVSGSYAVIDNCSLYQGWYDNLNTLNAYGWTLRDCTVTSPVRYGVYIRNVNVPDTGDSTITGCTFDNAGGTPTAVRYESSGGLRFVDSKILHYAYGLDLAIADGASTGTLVVTGNSFEVQDTASIRLGQAGSTGFFGRVNITGNEFLSSTGDGIRWGAGAYSVTVVGNNMTGAAGHFAVDCATGANFGMIAANLFDTYGTGIRLDAGVGLIQVGLNSYRNVAIPVQDNLPYYVGQASVEHSYTNRIAALTSTTVYTNYFTLDLDTFRAVQASLMVEGVLGGVGVFGRYISQIVSRGAGNVAITTVSDTAAGSVVDMQYDVTTTPGSVIIGMKRNAGAGGTQLDGVFTLKLLGHVKVVHVL